MNVANRKCIRRLSFAHMKSAKLRNIITVTAVALTTILFTTVFTVVMSIKDGYEQSNFRQVGGTTHGGFKYLTEEQVEELKDDPLIKEYGTRLGVGIGSGAPFHKNQVEVSYCDDTWAKYGFIEPVEGGLPKEGTNEAATDRRVLELLGVEPVIGNEFTMTMDVDGTETTETFTLCGYWDYDELATANHVIIPRSRAEEIFDKLDTKYLDGITGTWSLDVMFSSASHIRENMEKVLERHGYQVGDKNQGDGYIQIGVNWGYTGAQLSQELDFATVLGVVGVLLLIVFAGYLIIYNIFQISVANDVRFYGLLKTIGTTGRQIKRILRIQAVILAATGIPLGLVVGYGIGVLVSHAVIANLDGIKNISSLNPLIFIGAAVFSLFTVLISCRKPSRMAARISPVEAMRYTEAGTGRKAGKTARGAKKGASLFRMAWANLGRNKKKTAITVISMSLSLVILDITVIMTRGFDMDKYLKDVKKDFIVADASYFQARTIWGEEESCVLSEDVIAQIEARGNVNGGRTYGLLRGKALSDLVTEEQYRMCRSYWDSPEWIETEIEQGERVDGKLMASANLYGMEAPILDELDVLDGDISKVKEGNYIAAVYYTDDYGGLVEGAQWAKIGDQVTIHYSEFELYNINTGEGYENMEAARESDPSGASIGIRYFNEHSATYEVAATVTVSNKLSYRFGGSNDYVMNAEMFKRETGSDALMYYAFDCEEDSRDGMEQFLSDYTSKGAGSQYDYESRKRYEEEFYGFRNMFFAVGSGLSFITGLIGVLNFLNAILTSILTRKREFAVLQSVGMTGKQLKRMLMTEGIIFAGSSVVVTFAMSVLAAPLVSNVMESMYWFFSFHMTVAPIIALAPVFLLLGILIPMLSYRYVADKPIVERLREAE